MRDGVVFAEKLWRGDDDVEDVKNIFFSENITFSLSTELDDENVIYGVRSRKRDLTP